MDTTPLSNITVNGVPLSKVVDEEIRAEITTFKDCDVAFMKRVARNHFGTRSIRNHSGARSGKCITIYHAAKS